MHVDSSHTYRTTLAELSLCEGMMAERGIIVLDDFTNLDYSQIMAAIYKYLYTKRTELTVFLVTAEKAYLCAKQDFDYYGRYVLNGLLEDMALRGAGAVCLARTDWDPEYRAFCLRHQSASESDPYYGMQLYGHFYKEPNLKTVDGIGRQYGPVRYLEALAERLFGRGR
jgi:hypothetical protein